MSCENSPGRTSGKCKLQKRVELKMDAEILNKENVTPLRHGRDQSEDQTIRTQQNNFELELRSYSGDDPFIVWERYIKWTEQHDPQGGLNGQQMKLLERCFRELQEDERYTNDPRFIHTWIKFAYFTVDPVVVFKYMFDHGIGVKVAALYVEWAISLERNGDNIQAEAIYTEGLNRRAEPEDLLIQRHHSFKASQTDVLSNLRRPPASTNCLREIPMYQKNNIYNGGSEFRSEELRSVKYWKLKKEKEERLHKEEAQRLQEQTQQHILKLTERLEQLEAQVNSLNFNRPADHAAQQQTYATQQLELTQQIEEIQAIIPNNVHSTSEMTFETERNAFIQRALEQPGQQDAGNSNTNSNCSSFITPTGRPGDSHCASTKGSLRTRILNSASAYSLNSSSSGLPRLQGFRADTSSSNPSLEFSIVSTSNISSSNSTPLTVNSSSATSSHPSTFTAASAGVSNTTLVESNHPSSDCNIGSPTTESCTNTSGSSSVSKHRHANTKRPGSGAKVVRAIDFTIECGAKNEMTIARLDTFSLQAKNASTPCVSGLSRSQPQTQGLADAITTCSSSAYMTSERNVLSCKKYFSSPVLEENGEEYTQEIKSYQQSLAASKVIPDASSHTRHEDILKEDILEPMEADTEADRDVSMNEDIHTDLDKSCRHHVDTTTYITQNLQEKTQTSPGFDPKDPFNDDVKAQILHSLKPPISEYPNFVACSGQMPDIVPETMIYFGNAFIKIKDCIEEGPYAKIYKFFVVEENTFSIDSRIMQNKVIKVQIPACYWEFYVSTELRRRLTTLKAQMNVVPSIMEIEKGYFFEDRSIFLMAHASCGSLLNLVNKYKNDKSLLAGVEPFACLLTIELLHMFEQIHACGFIHSNVKPDNFLLFEMPDIKTGCKRAQEVFGSHLRLVQLIDFGQSIDLSKFPKGTTFLSKVATSGFQCIELRTNRPWTFQTDLFGLVGTVHLILFGSYMNVFEERGIWHVTGNFMRKWNVPLWKQLFKELLNVPSCDHQPDLARLRSGFETYFMENLIPSYNLWVQEIKRFDECH